MSKKRFLPILLLSITGLLAACQGGPNDTSASSSIQESVSSNEESTISSTVESSINDTTNDYVATDSKEGLVSLLLKLKEEQCFIITNHYDGTTILFNKNYYVNQSSKTAYVNLPYHRDGSRNLAYKVNYLSSGTPYVSAMAFQTDAYGNRYELPFEDFNFLRKISDDLNADAFVEEEGAYLTEDNGILSAFNDFYGITTTGKVSFWFDSDNKQLNYEVFDTSGASLTTGSVYHVSNAKDEALENFVKDFSWDKGGKGLTSEQASTLFDEDFSCSTDIYQGANQIATVDFSCNNDTIYIHSVNDPKNNPSDYYTYITENKKNGRAIIHGLDAQNTKFEEESSYFFEQWPLPKSLDIRDFRLCGDGNYRYFSIEPNDVYQTLVHVSVNDRSCSFEEAVLNMENDKVIGVTMTSPGTLLTSYQAVATLKPYEEITLPDSYEESGPREIERAMTYFDGKTPFKIVKTNRQNKNDATRKTTYTFDGTTYLIEEESYDSYTKEYAKNTYGYTTMDDGTVLPFRAIKGTNRLVQSDEPVENDTITNHFPKPIDPKTMKKTKDGTFVFRELVTDVFDTIWISNNVIPSTVELSVSGGKLTSASCEINYSSDDKEYLSFSYSGISLPSDIDVKNIGPMELTCYADDSPDEWSDLVNYIGEGNASLIPYYYDKKNVGNWYAEPRYASGTGIPDANENGQIDYDDPLIGIGLYCIGSSIATSVLDQGFTDNGFSKVTGDPIDVGYRDDDYIANGRDSEVYLVDPSTQTIWEKELEGGKKLRVVYDSDIAFYHFNPNIKANYSLSSGLLIQLFDSDGNSIINRNGTFH